VICEDNIARLQEQNASYLCVVERLEAEKAAANARVSRLEIALRNARHAATGGNAKKGTAELLRWIAGRWDIQAVEVGAPTKRIISDRASMLDAADQMMQSALSTEDN
jgi:hypothetical protein